MGHQVTQRQGNTLTKSIVGLLLEDLCMRSIHRLLIGQAISGSGADEPFLGILVNKILEIRCNYQVMYDMYLVVLWIL